jgi:REP element-mobilizing transposase RayT
VHVTSRFVPGLPNARRKELFRVIRGALRDKRVREGFRLAHFSVQSNHLHLVVEASDQGHLARGMQSVLITIAKRLNKWWGRKGQVVEDRYHSRQLRTPNEVRNALGYVLCNARRHGVAVSREAPDDRSSGRWFDGWKELAGELVGRGAPVARARTWLLSKGWRLRGLIPVAYQPRPG